MIHGTSKSNGLTRKLQSIEDTHKALKNHGLLSFAQAIDEKERQKCIREKRQWGTDIPSERLLRAIGYINANYFYQAGKNLEGIEVDSQHQLLSLFLTPKLGIPDKKKITWILKTLKYEKNYPEICLKAYASIGDLKKVKQLLDRGVKDSIGPEIPAQLRKSAVEFSLNLKNNETFTFLLKTLPLTTERAQHLLNKCLSRVQSNHALEVIKTIKDTEILLHAYKTHAREAYTYEETPRVCAAIEKKLSDSEIQDLINGLKSSPNTSSETELTSQRMQKSLKRQLQKLILTKESKKFDNISL
jgi:hypothetical protein